MKKIVQELPKNIRDYLSKWEYFVRIGWTDDGERYNHIILNSTCAIGNRHFYSGTVVISLS